MRQAASAEPAQREAFLDMAERWDRLADYIEAEIRRKKREKR
jgi:hypothetical protein